MSDTAEIFRPIIVGTYGEGATPLALVDHLASMIDGFVVRYPGDDRVVMVCRTCWDWFPGGDTAARVAEQIEVALTCGTEASS